MQLSKSFTKYNDKAKPVSSLGITVEFNTDTETVDKIVSVDVWDYHAGVFVDITDQMTRLFDISLDLVVNATDWREIFYEESEGVEEEYEQGEIR